MLKRAILSVSVGGSDISGLLGPHLISALVSLRAGEETDTASFVLDDTGGVFAMPTAGVPIVASLGWFGGGVRPVFFGTVDEVRSIGARAGGRTLSFTAKGFDTIGRTKSGQSRHWDNATVKTILKDAAVEAGVSDVSVDPDLAKITLKYFAMVEESFLHMGRRLAQQIGGEFQVQGPKALMARRGGKYTPFVLASAGVDLHSWDITPTIGRSQYGKVVATYYDPKAAEWKNVEVSTGLKATAVYTIRPAAADKADAERQAKAMAVTSKRDSGKGKVIIEGNTSAIPGGLCLIAGARAGIDGSYRISGVTHNINRSGGWTTDIDLNSPQGGAQEGA